MTINTIFSRGKKLIAGALLGLTIMPLSVNSVAGSDPFIGEIEWFAGNFAPRGWAFCDGSLLPINQYQALFSILGTTYGGDGRTTFALPDMRGRSPMHPGNGPGLSTRRLGERGGEEQVTLSVNEMPTHNHAMNASSNSGTDRSPADRVLADNSHNPYHPGPSNTTMSSASISHTGGGQPHNNMAPYLGVNCIIALQGLFPSRN